MNEMRGSGETPDAQIVVSAEILEKILDLPGSYRILGATSFEIDRDNPTVRLLVKSDSLPKVIPGDPVPELEVVYVQYTRSLVRLEQIKARV